MSRLKPKFHLLLMSFLMTLKLVTAQTDSIKNTTVWNKIEAYTPTKIALPNNYDSTKEHTLIISLHGYGGTAEGNLRWLSKPFTDAGFIFAAPQALYPVLHDNGKLGYEWFLIDISSAIMLERPASKLEIAAMRTTTDNQMGQVISDLKDKYKVDKIYFAGFSQGGIITYLSGIHYHDKIDGMIIFSSVVDEDWLGDDNIKDGKGVRTLIIQGEQDKVVPIELAENGRDLLLENGYDVTYKKFDGEHTVPKNLMDFVIDWIGEK